MLHLERLEHLFSWKYSKWYEWIKPTYVLTEDDLHKNDSCNYARLSIMDKILKTHLGKYSLNSARHFCFLEYNWVAFSPAGKVFQSKHIKMSRRWKQSGLLIMQNLNFIHNSICFYEVSPFSTRNTCWYVLITRENIAFKFHCGSLLNQSRKT